MGIGSGGVGIGGGGGDGDDDDWGMAAGEDDEGERTPQPPHSNRYAVNLYLCLNLYLYHIIWFVCPEN